MEYIDFDELGRFVPNIICVGETERRIAESARYYGLNLEKMREARFEVMKEVKDLYETIIENAKVIKKIGDDAPMNSIKKQLEQLKAKTRADAVFSLAARIQLQKLGVNSDIFIDKSLDAA